MPGVASSNSLGASWLAMGGGAVRVVGHLVGGSSPVDAPAGQARASGLVVIWRPPFLQVARWGICPRELCMCVAREVVVKHREERWRMRRRKMKYLGG